MPQSVTKCLVVVGSVLLFVFALWVGALGGVTPHVRSFQAAYLVGFVGFLLLITALSRSNEPAVLGPWPWWLAGLLTVRLILIATAPSDDAFRYAWEGRVQLAGYNPYHHPPNDPLFQPLRSADWPQINHPGFPAIYPPLAQMEFLAAAAIHPSAYTIKCLHVVWDMLAVFLLAACLSQMGRAPHWAAVYAACPLVLSAFAVEGHLDSLMLLPLVGMIWAHQRGKSQLAGLCLALAICAKTVAVVLLPWFMWRHPKAIPTLLAVIVCCYLPYGSGGLAGLRHLLRFAEQGASFSVLAMFPAAWTEPAAFRLTCVAALLVLLTTAASRRRSAAAYGRTAFAALLLLLPIVHYWYLAWVLIFQPFRIRARWVVAAASAALYFEAQRRKIVYGEWSMPPWAPAAMWLPFFSTWIVECGVRRRITPSGRPARPPESAS